ncbi:MAG: hypothetical protein Q4D51_00880 [Eubacteriales bacterium]|nr:hypothetical protein [Eubacteriales bacterium]
MRRMRKQTVCLILFLGSVVSLCGCKKVAFRHDMRNVEERDYATVLILHENEEDENYQMVLGIAKEKIVGEKSMVEDVSRWEEADLLALQKDYENVKGKNLSLAHLKVILCNCVPSHATIEMLEKENDVAKTCPVLIVEQEEEFQNYMKESKEPVGNYLERLIRIQEKKGKKLTWLLDYSKQMHEDDDLQIMVLKKRKEGYEIE